MRILAVSMPVLLIACSPAAPDRAASKLIVPMPTMTDALSSNLHDSSCACLNDRGACANLAEAAPGEFEGRDLTCGKFDPATRSVECRLEERFVNWKPGDRHEPEAWQVRLVRLTFEKGGWCR